MKFVLPPCHVVYPLPNSPVCMSNKKMKETQTFQMVELYYVICALKGEAKAKPHLLKYFLQ